MKLKSLGLLVLAAMAIAGCSKKEETAPAGKTGQSAEATPKKTVPTAGAPVDAEPGLATVKIDNVRLGERDSATGKGKDWLIRATVINSGGEPLDGGQFVIDLVRKGEVQPFVRHSSDIFFSPAVVPGRSTALIASVPNKDVKDVPSLDGIEVHVKVLKALKKPKIAPAWKPLDPKKAEVRVVSDTVIMTPDGKILARIPREKADQLAAARPGGGAGTSTAVAANQP
jgi:hypothetical protein